MNRHWLLLLAISVLCFQAALAQSPAPANTVAVPVREAPTPERVVLRELHGVTLDMPREAVKSQFGKPSSTKKQMDEFKLDGGDLLTVRYDPKGMVKVIQLYCTDTKRAPAWEQVVGDAEIQQRSNGSKFARKVVAAEKYWITMYQSKSGLVTTITLSR